MLVSIFPVLFFLKISLLRGLWQIWGRQKKFYDFADMAELADAIDLGSIVKRRAGSSPVIRTV